MTAGNFVIVPGGLSGAQIRFEPNPTQVLWTHGPKMDDSLAPGLGMTPGFRLKSSSAATSPDP
jgi:hypothetical protein